MVQTAGPGTYSKPWAIVCPWKSVQSSSIASEIDNSLDNLLLDRMAINYNGLVLQDWELFIIGPYYPIWQIA